MSGGNLGKGSVTAAQRYAAGGAAEEPRRALQVWRKGEGDLL